MGEEGYTFPVKRGSLILLLIFSLLCTSCQQGTEPFYVRSSRAGGGGEKYNVVDVTIAHQSMQVTDPNVVTFTIGMGGNAKPAAHENESMFLEISAEGCLINGVEDLFENEYPDYYENEAFRATVEEHYWRYPTKTPNYFEDFEITFPSGECRGKITITLYSIDSPLENYRAELTIYYASNGTVFWFSDSALREVDQNNRPVRVDD